MVDFGHGVSDIQWLIDCQTFNTQVPDNIANDIYASQNDLCEFSL